MEKINFQDNITKANAETMNTFQDNIENAINEVLNIVCPIGKVEIFFDNHSNYLGFTWERTSIGKTPVGIDTLDTDFDVTGKTGGEKKHTLTVSEMPSHKHQIYVNRDTGVTGLGNYYPATQVTTASNYVDNNICEYVGENQPHNILQPYEVMAFWKRIA